ncbi:hypothetical protein O0L34_g16653 [Tuta absoluta]|nr:hypothetical protein O0L34_g16653 [Tuta absoluta]
MFAWCFLACLALASAAPQSSYIQFDTPSRHKDRTQLIFNGFGEKMNFAEEAAKMQTGEQGLNELHAHAPSIASKNDYVVTKYQYKFEEKDITVKAGRGIVKVEAVHNTNSYTAIDYLPSNVNENGTWTFEAGVLKIVFPRNSK